MTSDYIKQIEEDNWTLRSKLEQLEAHCEWLEMLRLLRVTSVWGAASEYSIGINNYRTRNVGQYDAFFAPRNKIVADVLDWMNEEIIKKYAVSTSGVDKSTIKHAYEGWRGSILSFVTISKSILDTPDYKSINKLSLSTDIHLSLLRLSADSRAIESFDDPQNDKDIFQGCTILIKRTGGLPSVKVMLKKTINGFKNNKKFMDFDRDMRTLTNIFDEIERIKKKAGDYEGVEDCD